MELVMRQKKKESETLGASSCIKVVEEGDVMFKRYRMGKGKILRLDYGVVRFDKQAMCSRCLLALMLDFVPISKHCLLGS